MATYLEHYQYYLEEQLAKGGTPAYMEECVQQYNAAGRLDFRPGAVYVAWVKKTRYVCTTCGFDFAQTAEAPPDPNQEVTCESCIRRTASTVREVPADRSGSTDDRSP